jgi:UDP:flavonoid glycosyltransferase YjiC (YdhE family)
MPGIDLLVSSGGYNSVHESRYSGTPLLAIPQKRVYDRQADRLLASEAVSNLDTALDLAKKIIATPAASQQNPDSVRKKNGTHEAFNLIMETLKKT